VKCSEAQVAAIAAKMENANSGPVHEAGISALKRCHWLRTKNEDGGWFGWRAEHERGEKEFDQLDSVRDPRADKLNYGAAPSLSSKYGL
jgi:hypothetical protein